MKKILTVTIIFQLLTLIGCGTLYVPNTVHTPLLRGKNDFKVAGQYSIFSDNELLGAQIAYSPIEHFGIIVDANVRQLQSPDDYYFYKGTESFEIGGGYYFPPSENTVYEIYTGYGIANLYLRDVGRAGNNGKPNGKYERLFLIQNIGYVAPHGEISFGLRLTHFKHNLNSQNNKTLFTNPTRLYIEPALTIKGGLSNAKFFFQIQSSKYILYDKNISNESGTSLSIGVEVQPFELLK